MTHANPNPLPMSARATACRGGLSDLKQGLKTLPEVHCSSWPTGYLRRSFNGLLGAEVRNNPYDLASDDGHCNRCCKFDEKGNPLVQ